MNFFNLEQFAYIQDPYAPLDYKYVNGNPVIEGQTWLAPTWVGEDNKRRLQSYKILLSYRDNKSRNFLLFDPTLDPADDEAIRDLIRSRREYGDTHLLVEQVRSSLIGDQQTIAVEGADDYNPDADTTPGDEADVDSDELSDDTKARQAFELQEKLQAWAKRERLPLKMIKTERNAVGLGDGVYVLTLDAKSRRIRLRTYDPGFYFPVVEDTSAEDFVRKVHIAWEIEPRPGDTNRKTRIHRLTWELREVEAYFTPWGTAVENCYFSEAEWEISDNARDVDDLDVSKAMPVEDEQGLVWERPLNIDYIPVIHIPNTVPEEHFGTATPMHVLQLLDDIQSTDSDLAAAASMYGSPMLALSGAKAQDNITIGPGEAFDLGVDGDAKLLQPGDLSVLSVYLESLLQRFEVNARTPGAVLGRVDPSKIEAGIILQLSFGPLKSYITEMRLVRGEKYPLLLKFVTRFMMQLGEWTGPELPAEVVFGSYLPNDQAGMATMVSQLYAAKLISLQSAIKMLQSVGFDIDDVSEEMDAIDKRDYEGANLLFDATGNEDDVSEMLGVPVTRPQAPELTLNLPQPPSGTDPAIPERTPPNPPARG